MLEANYTDSDKENEDKRTIKRKLLFPPLSPQKKRFRSSSLPDPSELQQLLPVNHSLFDTPEDDTDVQMTPIDNPFFNTKNHTRKFFSTPHSTTFRQKKTRVARIISPLHESKIPNTFCYQTIGGRKDQQDALSTGSITDFEQLSAEDQKEVLKGVFIELQQNYGQYKRSGSTVALCISYGNKIIIANLGDSPIYLIKKDLDDNIFECQRLNTLHRHGADSQVHKLDITHAIGDTNVDDLSRDPEILFFETDDNDMLLIASDGLIYSPPKTGEDDQQYIYDLLKSEEIKNLPLEEIPKKLKEKAIADGSRDNISMILNQIDTQNPCPKIFVVCDGHGPEGREVSTAIVENLPRILNEKTQQFIHSRAFKMA